MASEPDCSNLRPKLAHILAHNARTHGGAAGSHRAGVYTHRIELLDRVVHDASHNAQAPPLLRNVIRLAQLGGYLARASDPPPGNTVMWRGMRRLTDIQLGYELALKRSG